MRQSRSLTVPLRSIRNRCANIAGSVSPSRRISRYGVFIVTENEPDQDAYKRKAQMHKEVFERKQAASMNEKRLVIVTTGTGKGKSTAAFGMGLRVLGDGMKLGLVQFIKGALFSAEREVLGSHTNCVFRTIGDGYTWDTQDREKDIATAERAWQTSVRMIRAPSFHMVIPDELNVVLKHKYLNLERKRVWSFDDVRQWDK
jgi:cob(I)alamin adenosyltransferase